MSEMRWNFDADTKQLYLVDGQRKIKILKLDFLKNGVSKDYCIVKGIDGEPNIAKIEETPKDKILGFLPEADIAFIEMDELYNGGKFLIFTPTSETTKMLDARAQICFKKLRLICENMSLSPTTSA